MKIRSNDRHEHVFGMILRECLRLKPMYLTQISPAGYMDKLLTFGNIILIMNQTHEYKKIHGGII